MGPGPSGGILRGLSWLSGAKVCLYINDFARGISNSSLIPLSNPNSRSSFTNPRLPPFPSESESGSDPLLKGRPWGPAPPSALKKRPPEPEEPRWLPGSTGTFCGREAPPGLSGRERRSLEALRPCPCAPAAVLCSLLPWLPLRRHLREVHRIRVRWGLICCFIKLVIRSLEPYKRIRIRTGDVAFCSAAASVFCGRRSGSAGPPPPRRPRLAFLSLLGLCL